MPPPHDPEALLRDEFHRLLGRLVHAIAQFDFLVGLQLRHLGPYRGRDVPDLLQTRKARLGERLQRLRVLVLETYATAGPAFNAQFNKWFDDAERARALRNDYAHGRWAVPAKYGLTEDGRRNLNEPMLAFVPLDFDMTPDQPDKSIYMTIVEFSAHVELAEALFSRYWKLCEKHIGHALPQRSDP